MFKPESTAEKGTIYNCKVIIRRNDVNGNVKSNYKAHEDLLLLMTKALIQVAAEDLKEESEFDREAVLCKLLRKIQGINF